MTERMEPGQQLLFKLFQSWEQNPDSTRRKSLPINKVRAAVYYETKSPEDKDSLHACLVNAEKEGCVELVWGKHHDNHLLKKILLDDAKKLSQFLNIRPARDLAEESAEKITQLFPTEDPWLIEIQQDVLAQWSKNKPAYNIKPNDVEELVLTLKALGAVKNNQNNGMDLRTFSAKVLKDSKAMERIQDRFTTIWNKHHNTPNKLARELLESLGLAKFPPSVFLKGPLRFICADSPLDISHIPAFVGIPPDIIDIIETTISPRSVEYVLSIENLASFNRHCREVDDHGCGIVIFSSGYLSPKTAEIMKSIEALLPKTVPFYHWGDIDPGGLNIYSHLCSIIDRKINLHLMDKDLLSEHGVKQKEKISFRYLQKSAHQNPKLIELIQECQEKQIILEQEIIDPQKPK